MADKPPSEPGGMFTHMPLPYIVRVRVVSDEDAPPVQREFRLSAYSVMEAVMQVSLECGASEVNDAKVKVEEIRPDLSAYGRMFRMELDALMATSVRGKP